MLDIEEVAQQLGCTVSGVRKVVARGEIRYFQHGKRGRLKFKPEWVEEFVCKHTVAPKDETPQKARPKPKKRLIAGKCENRHGLTWDLLRRQ